MKLRSTLSARINRDPNLLPVNARAFCAFTVMVMCMIYMLAPQHIGFARTLEACGIVLGVFGAGVLYWETVAEVQELQSVYKETAHMGSSTKLSLGQIVSVIVIVGLGFIIAYLQAGAIALSARHNPNQAELYTALRVVPVFIIYAIPALGFYGGTKWVRRFCSRWAERFQASQDMTAEIKRYLRLIGFRSLFFAGLAQLPATLVSAH
jgi:hypothetical protein